MEPTEVDEEHQVKAKNKYFMISVTLLEVELGAKEARKMLESDLDIQAASHIRVATQKLAEAAEELFRVKGRAAVDPRT